MDMMSGMIREARNSKRLSQAQLAGLLSTSRTTIQYLEGSQRNCSLEILAGIHRVLEARVPLSVWALASLDRTIAARTTLNDSLKITLHEDIVQAIEMLMPARNQVVGSPGSLGGFPKGFEPLTVVVGDRREEPPITRGDILAGSASTEDVRHLLSIGLKDSQSVIRTDKIIMNATEADLRRAFGNTNLLIVGSPFVNFAARIINGHTPFKFGPLSELRAWTGNLGALRQIHGIELEAFAAMSNGRIHREKASGSRQLSAERVAELEQLFDALKGASAAEPLKEGYRPSEIIDPVQRVIHPATKGSYISYGVINLSSNPFSDSGDFVAVSVAGVHLAGTVMALKALSEGDFADRPIGGVIEVIHPGPADESWWSWRTPRYSIDDFTSSLQFALDTTRAKRHPALRAWTDEELEACLVFHSP